LFIPPLCMLGQFLYSINSSLLRGLVWTTIGQCKSHVYSGTHTLPCTQRKKLGSFSMALLTPMLTHFVYVYMLVGHFYFLLWNEIYAFFAFFFSYFFLLIQKGHMSKH
jgi:hypothetical protein